MKISYIVVFALMVLLSTATAGVGCMEPLPTMEPMYIENYGIHIQQEDLSSCGKPIYDDYYMK